MKSVIPAKAGIQWMDRMDSGLRRNDEKHIRVYSCPFVVHE